MSVRDDIELAREISRQHNGKPPRTQRVAGQVWTPERAALTDIADILLRVLASVEAARTGKTNKPPTMPRPVDALARLEKIEAQQRHQDRVRAMLGR